MNTSTFVTELARKVIVYEISLAIILSGYLPATLITEITKNMSITNNDAKFATAGPSIPAKTAIYRIEIISNAAKIVETNR